MKKRIISFVTSLAMMLTVAGSFPVGVHATDSTETSGSLTAVNPVYEDVLAETDVENSIQETQAATPSMATLSTTEPTYTEDNSVIADTLREAMAARMDSVTAYYASADGITQELLDSWIQEAVQENGVNNQGDYLKWQIGGSSLDWTCDKEENGKYYYTLVFGFTYYTTAEEEAQVDAAVSEVLSSLSLDSLSEYEKIKAIYQWAIENVSYDNEHVSDDTYLYQFTAYAALINKTAVCQGFANMLYRLYNEAGIDCRIVCNGGITHTWNIVKLGDKYYHVDASSDAGSTPTQFLRGSSSPTGSAASSDIVSGYNVSECDYYLTLISAPENLTVAAEGTTATLTWDAVTNAYNYKVYYKESSAESYENWGSVKTTTCTVEDLTGGTAYDFMVMPSYYNEFTKSQYYDESISSTVSTSSSTTTEDTEVILEAPTTLSSTATAWNTVKATWGAVKGAEGYNVYYKDEAASDYTKAGSTTEASYTISDLSASTTYTIKVVPYSGTTEGENYATTQAVTPEKPAKEMSVPTISAVLNDDNTISLSWSASTNADGYDIYVKGGDYTDFTLYEYEYTLESYTHYQTADGIEYSYKVIPYYWEGSERIFGTESDPVSVETKKVLSDTTNTAAEVMGTNSIKLTWDEVVGADGYTLYYRQGTEGDFAKVCDLSASARSYTVTGLKANTTYQFHVASYYNYNGAKEYCEYKSYVKATTAEEAVVIPAPLAPTNLKATLSSWATVTLSWVAPENANKYKVYYKKSTDSSYTLATTTTSTSYKLSLSQGTKYYFKVVPYNGEVKGTASDYISLTTKKNLPAPAKASTKLYGYDDVQVSWSAVTGAAGYDVYYKKATAKTYSYLGATTKRYYKKGNLADGVKYNFKIVPYYTVDKVKYQGSKYKTASIYTLKKMSKPTVKKSGKSVKVSYKTFTGASGYQIAKSKYKNKKYTVVKTVSGSKKTYGIVKATKGKTYYYKVRMYKTVNGKRIYGSWSKPTKFKRK